MITICFVYFKSLTLANLEAALYSLYKQDFVLMQHFVESLVIVDNDTDDSVMQIKSVLEKFEFPIRNVELHSLKHDDPLKTHAWSTNTAVGYARTPWVLFCRADYLLDSNLLAKFLQVREAHHNSWNGFITADGRHLHVNMSQCEETRWRIDGAGILQNMPGMTYDYTAIDTGVWLARKDAFDAVHGLDEKLSAWGHSQTHFQYKLYKDGVDFVRIPEVLFYHPQHSATRDIELAHSQLNQLGVDIRELWARYEGSKPY